MTDDPRSSSGEGPETAGPVEPPLASTGFLVAIAAAVAIILAGIAAGLVVGGAFKGAAAAPSPAAADSARGLGDASSSPGTPRPTATMPTQKPSTQATAAPSGSPELVVPTAGPPGPDGIPPPLPQIVVAGADPSVVAEIAAAVEQFDALAAYRFRGGVSGRTIVDLAGSGLNFGVEATAARRDVDAVDALIAFQMVEFDGAAGITSTERYVIIGDAAWSVRASEAESMPSDSIRGFVELLMPRGIADRTLVPFAGGFQRVGSEAHNGTPAVHFKLTRAGEEAYAAVTGVDGTWAGDLWIAEAGYVAGFRVHGEAAGGSDGFLVEIELSDVNDPGIVIGPPA